MLRSALRVGDGDINNKKILLVIRFTTFQNSLGHAFYYVSVSHHYCSELFAFAESFALNRFSVDGYVVYYEGK